MLSRTADSLFWLARYSERAGNVARGISVAWRTAGFAARLGTEGAEWGALLTASGGDELFYQKHAAPTQEAVLHWLVHDRDNPSGIFASIEAARRNARNVRTALTVDMWEAMNDTWNQLRQQTADITSDEKLADFLSWVRERVMLLNGAAADTMLREEAWMFVRLGTMLERADNTARLLDVHHTKLTAPAGEAVDYVQWQSVLRSVSALRSYHYIYRDRLQPRRIAELIILRPELPRSLMACHMRVGEMLEGIAAIQGGRRGRCHALSEALQARLRDRPIDGIMAEGLHGFLTAMIERAAELGGAIEEFYIAH
jgi:uncharacterized alpha-E superfamily protein